MANFNLQIISPEQMEFTGDVESIVAPGVGGYFGVLAHHAALLSALGEGTLTAREESGTSHVYNVKGGFLEVHQNKVVVLVQQIEETSAA